MNAEIDEYESHESWLARQLVELERMTDLPHDPPPRVLAPLPWWKDEQRINGEAQRILDALRFAWEVTCAVVKSLLRGFFRHTAGIVVTVMVCLFLCGWLLSRL